MNAQEAWKHLYQGWKQAPIYTLGGNYPKYCERGAMKDIRREAALERKCEALQRQLEAAQNIMRHVLPILKEDISAIGDDHSVGICCCDIIYRAQDIEEWLDPEKKRQRELTEQRENEL